MQLHDYGRHDEQGRPGAPRRTGKFVILHHAGAQHLCLAPRERATFHANIVELFCRAQGLSYRYNRKQDLLEADGGLVVEGGGHFELDTLGCSLRLFGRSIGYGPFARAGLRNKALAIEALRGYTIIVEPEGA